MAAGCLVLLAACASQRGFDRGALSAELSPEACGRLLKWGHAADPAGGEVSFASMAFTD